MLPIIFLAFALFTGPSTAAPIEGGFGLKLGTILNTESSLAEKVDGFSNTVFQVKPPAPLKGFEHYTVYVTPISHTIYQIKAIRKYELLEDAQTDFEILNEVLARKYGKKETTNRSKTGTKAYVPDNEKGSTYDSKESSVNISIFKGRNIRQFNRYTHEYSDSPRVSITYRSNLRSLLEREKKELRKRNSDAGNNRETRIRDAQSSL